MKTNLRAIPDPVNNWARGEFGMLSNDETLQGHLNCIEDLLAHPDKACTWTWTDCHGRKTLLLDWCVEQLVILCDVDHNPGRVVGLRWVAELLGCPDKVVHESDSAQECMAAVSRMVGARRWHCDHPFEPGREWHGYSKNPRNFTVYRVMLKRDTQWRDVDDLS